MTTEITKMKPCFLCRIVFKSKQWLNTKNNICYETYCKDCKSKKSKERAKVREVKDMASNVIKNGKYKKCTHAFRYEDKCIMCALKDINPHLETTRYHYSFMN